MKNLKFIFTLVAISFLMLSCSNDSNESDDIEPIETLIVEVSLREKLSIINYPNAVHGKTTGVSVRAFGLEPGIPLEEWRETTLEELITLFEAYIIEHNITNAERYVLDFEKEWAHVHTENRAIIERSIEAVRLVRPNVDISLFGTPFIPVNGNLSQVFFDPNYLNWIQSLNIGYVPVLYLHEDNNGNFPTLEDVEALTELSLSVFPKEESTSFLWHKWKNGGNWQTNPNVIDTYSNLEPLQIQIDILNRLGYSNICFWHGDDDTEISEMLETLFGN